MSYSFKATVLILPGLSDSGEDHWQTRWQWRYDFIRVEQKDWETPIREAWVETLDKKIAAQKNDNIILVGHSLACATIGFWSSFSKREIKGALLVAPSDTEAASLSGTVGFAPMPLNKLRFPSITVASQNDFYVSISRAEFFAEKWGSELIDIGYAAHINTAAGFGEWPAGLDLLKRLDK